MIEAELIQKILGLQSGMTEMTEETDAPTVVVPVDSLLALALALRDTPELAFDQLTDHTSVDWLKENRFELLYRFYSLQHGHGLLVSCSVPRETPVAPSLSGIWPIAEWQEPGDPRAAITIRDLLQMSSGLDFVRIEPDDPAFFSRGNCVCSCCEVRPMPHLRST